MEPKNPEFSQMMSEEAEKAMEPEVSPEVAPEKLSPEQEEQAKYWLEVIEKETVARQEKNPEQLEIEKKESVLMEIFETWLVPEKLDALHELKTQAEAMTNPLRKEAKAALCEITKIIIPRGEEFKPLFDKYLQQYRILSRAVGMINSGMVDHTR
jgi:hypothetical protein